MNVTEVDYSSSTSNIFASVADFADVAPPPQTATQGRTKHRLEVTDVKDWKVGDVLDWLEFLRDTDGKRMRESMERIFIENDINGKILITLEEKNLQTMGISSFGKRKKLAKEIERLKKNRGMCFLLLCAGFITTSVFIE